jgi:hypothetical protein
MPIFYSPSKKGFYDSRIEYNSYPSDIIDVTDRYSDILTSINTKGMEIKIEFGEVVLVEKLKQEITWDQIKKERNDLLLESDWTQLPDVNLSNKEEWKTYRQKLREITTVFSNTSEVVFPQKPQ